jgi:hypothetical protein
VPFAAKPTNLEDSLSKIDSNLKELTVAAEALNSVSDQLTKQVSAIEAVVNKLNLGIKAKVIAYQASNMDQTETHYVKLAYGKASGRWGFFIEEFTDQVDWPEYDDFESWPFTEAPRQLRITAVDKIPELLEALVKESAETTKALVKKVEYATELAARVAPAKMQAAKK